MAGFTVNYVHKIALSYAFFKYGTFLVQPTRTAYTHLCNFLKYNESAQANT